MDPVELLVKQAENSLNFEHQENPSIAHLTTLSLLLINNTIEETAENSELIGALKSEKSSIAMEILKFAKDLCKEKGTTQELFNIITSIASLHLEHCKPYSALIELERSLALFSTTPSLQQEVYIRIIDICFTDDFNLYKVISYTKNALKLGAVPVHIKLKASLAEKKLSSTSQFSLKRKALK